MGGNDHAGRVEALQVLIDGFSGLGSDLDGDQDLFHGDGSAGRLGGPALRIGDGDLGDAVCQDRGGHGISGHFRGQAEAVARLHHHSGGVEALPGLIGCLIGRLLDSQALQLERTTAPAAAGQIEHLPDFAGREFLLLSYLMENVDKIISKERLYEQVWGEYSSICDNTIMVHIRHLREKIEDTPSDPQQLITVKGLGYKLKKRIY